ncbi:unnamed protein product [Clonostachys rhizophaga]|uniref:PPM-type phosphatase domain-containing protein n=1 Tax=Clonostachys rhizophaga TaxID=160324 RepID=A0A9N9VYX6_9HYPO|nr:unnamed protein product [Clonostachys rhizophaga]
MFRLAARSSTPTATTASILLRRNLCPRTLLAFQRRAYTSASQGGQTGTSSAYLKWGGLGAATLLGSGAYISSSSSSQAEKGPPKAAAASEHIPTINQLASEDDIVVRSPIKALSLQDADEKLRESARTFVFDSKDGAKGRIDVVCLPSNHPKEDDWSVGTAKGIGGAATVYAGVYDGHVGWAMSTILREALIPYVSTALSRLSSANSEEAVVAAIKTAFTKLDDRAMNAGTEVAEKLGAGSAEAVAALAPAFAGSCALLTIYDPIASVLRTAVAGDSRAVLGYRSPATSDDYQMEELSLDQTGLNKTEAEKISKEHPGEKDLILDPNSGRLLGMAVTRSFGDSRWKWPLELLQTLRESHPGNVPRPNYKTPPYMTAEPEVTTRVVSSDDFVILATDGLWDHISSEDAVKCVSRWLQAHKANKPEAQPPTQGSMEVSKLGWSYWNSTPEDFIIEDLDNASVCLVKNAFGGARRELFRTVMTVREPASRYFRDDVTVQVIFFKDPYKK